ncbi:MAG: serine/threonine protein phosphatase [Flavobacteriales bacterium]|nr:serine/threonine protein phosphatase [Flavobacteriales bacterium]
MKRTLVVGDIHGGLKALQQVLLKAEINTKDTVIFVGDYVDGWSDSPDVVTFLIDFSKKNKCIFIRGNHDDLCHKWLLKDEIPEQWLQHGGKETMQEYKKLSKKEKKAHIDFFNNMVDYYTDSKDRLFVHAGFQNQHGPEYEFHKTAFYWDRTLWEMAIAVNKNLSPQDIRYPKRLLLYKEIFIGHTPVTRIGKTTPYQAENVWNVDTGAAFKGTVSILDADSKNFWQSDPVWQLYPGENGRN